MLLLHHALILRAIDLETSERRDATPKTSEHGIAVRLKLALPVRLALTVFPQTTGCFLFSYESEMVGSAGNAAARRLRLCFLTPDVQSGSRITSLKNW